MASRKGLPTATDLLGKAAAAPRSSGTGSGCVETRSHDTGKPKAALEVQCKPLDARAGASC